MTVCLSNVRILLVMSWLGSNTQIYRDLKQEFNGPMEHREQL